MHDVRDFHVANHRRGSVGINASQAFEGKEIESNSTMSTPECIYVQNSEIARRRGYRCSIIFCVMTALPTLMRIK